MDLPRSPPAGLCLPRAFPSPANRLPAIFCGPGLCPPGHLSSPTKPRSVVKMFRRFAESLEFPTQSLSEDCKDAGRVFGEVCIDLLCESGCRPKKNSPVPGDFWPAYVRFVSPSETVSRSLPGLACRSSVERSRAAT